MPTSAEVMVFVQGDRMRFTLSGDPERSPLSQRSHSAQPSVKLQLLSEPLSERDIMNGTGLLHLRPRQQRRSTLSTRSRRVKGEAKLDGARCDRKIMVL